MKFSLMSIYPQGAASPPPTPPRKGAAATEPEGGAETDLRRGWQKTAVSPDGVLARGRGTLSCPEHIRERAREEIATGICHSNFSKALNV